MTPLRPLVMAAGLALAAAPAAASPSKEEGGGPLSQVVNGLKEKSGQTGGGGSGGGAVGDPAPSTPPPESNWGVSGAVYTGEYGPPPAGLGPYPTGGDTETRIYLGLHSVEGSNGAGVASLRSSFGDNGLELDDIRYFERMADGQYLSMDVWSMSLAHRAVATGKGNRTALWLKGGLAGAHSDGLGLFGAVVGAELTHNLGPSLGFETGARYFFYQDDIRAVELRAGVAASILRVSYRLLRFDVGPPLRGPELGVALSF